MLLYLNLLEKNRDMSTLEKAYTYLRTDKRVPSDYKIIMLRCTFSWILRDVFCFLQFALCLGDIVPVGLGKYLHVLTEAICNPEVSQASGDVSVEQLLEKIFIVFMDHANLWADISTLPEVNCPELSESNLYR
jgi:calcineurin-binding protein cabin-1